MCRPETFWSAEGDDTLHFSLNELSRSGTVWYSFICVELLPTIQVTEVNKDRTTLFYAIVLNKAIDVGQVIRNSIQKAIKGGLTDGLPHPSLICGLYAEAKATWGADGIL